MIEDQLEKSFRKQVVDLNEKVIQIMDSNQNKPRGNNSILTRKSPLKHYKEQSLKVEPIADPTTSKMRSIENLYEVLKLVTVSI